MALAGSDPWPRPMDEGGVLVRQPIASPFSGQCFTVGVRREKLGIDGFVNMDFQDKQACIGGLEVG